MGSDGELLAEDEYRYIFNPSRWQPGQFYRVIESSPKVWRRFALLLLNGKKYTIGDSFKSREDQGEYIFWFRDDENDQWNIRLINESPQRKRVGSMCDIQIVDDKYWVTPLGEISIRINGAQIKGRSELQFGDYLIFGGHSEANKKTNCEGCLNYPNVLWFRKRELNPAAFLKDFNAATEQCNLSPPVETNIGQETQVQEGGCTPPALENVLILSHILSYFSCKDLKLSRFVSKQWDQEVKKWIKEKARVTFRLDSGRWRDHWDRANDSMQFVRYSLEMKETRIQNWTIRLPAFPATLADGPESKLYSDLLWFFSKEMNHPVKSLALKGEICSELDFKVRLQILESVQATLEELDLNVSWPMQTEELPTLFSSCQVLFPKLQRLKIWWDRPVPAWVEMLIPRVTGVKSLSLAGSIFDQQIFVDKLASFTNLVEVQLDTTSPIGVKSLLKGVNNGLKLKKMELGQFKDMTAEGISDLNDLLSRNASSLEVFSFILPPRLESSLRIEFPVLPKLKQLHFGLADSNYRNSSYEGSICFGEPMGRLNYAVHLPVIQSLSIAVWGVIRSPICQWGKLEFEDISRFWKKYAVLTNIFFSPHYHGETLQVCETLRVLDIPFRGSGNGQDGKNVIFKRAPELARVFPNVHNQWTTEARSVLYSPPTPGEIEKRRRLGLALAKKFGPDIDINKVDWYIPGDNWPCHLR